MSIDALLPAPRPDWEGLRDCIMRRGTPRRVHHIELFLDEEVKALICRRFGLNDGFDPNSPTLNFEREIRLQRFLGYDYVRVGVENVEMPLNRNITTDTAELGREEGRSFVNEHIGPITSWEDFENYPWPSPDDIETVALQWYEDNLPDDMCVIGSGGFAHFAEHLSWLPGYETLCYMLFDRRDLLHAIVEKLTELYEASLRRMLEFDCVKMIWGSDDMGFKTGTLISPDDLREFVLPGHRLMAQISHEADRPYLLHACGKLDEIMDDLIQDVGIDARHSFEDTIESVTEANRHYGDHIALLGGIDVDFLCRAPESGIRRRVGEVLDECMSGGGYCLGSGNSVANYIPLGNYLAMLDEGRRWGG